MIDIGRHSAWPRVLLALLLPISIIPSAVLAVAGHADVPAESAHPVPPIAVAAVMVGIQVRHGMAVARFERPRGWVVTFTTLVACAYLPSPVLHWWNWPGGAATLVQTSILMLFRGRARAISFAAALVSAPANEIYIRHMGNEYWGLGLGFWLASWTSVWALPFVQYTTVLLVRRSDELRATRADYADQAVRRGRLRLSRDLHDLLGQALTAITAKSELARRLLAHGADGASEQLADVTTIAESTPRRVLTVSEARAPMSLTKELVNAQKLLTDAGIAVAVQAAGPDLDVFACAVRETVTNILRHSKATSVTITSSQHNGAACLQVVNDGVTSVAAWGTGLTGLSHRATEHGGSVETVYSHDGRFRLLVEVPMEVDH